MICFSIRVRNIALFSSENQIVTTRDHEKIVLEGKRCVQSAMGHSNFNIDSKIADLLGNAKSGDSTVVLIVKNAGMRARFAKCHAISSIAVQERALCSQKIGLFLVEERVINVTLCQNVVTRYTLNPITHS